MRFQKQFCRYLSELVRSVNEGEPLRVSNRKRLRTQFKKRLQTGQVPREVVQLEAENYHRVANELRKRYR